MTEVKIDYSTCQVEKRSDYGAKGTECFALGEKWVRSFQVCVRCGRTYLFKQGRKFCPQCWGLLIVKTTILKRHNLSS